MTSAGPALTSANNGWGGNGGTNANGSSGNPGVVIIRYL